MLAWIAVRCLDTSRQRQSAIVAMFSANLIAQSAADIWHIEINLESDRLLVVIAVLVFVLAFWPARWTHLLDRRNKPD